MTQSDADLAAQWMADQIDKHGELYQIDAAEYMPENFSEGLTYENNNGNLAISESVRSRFKTLTKDTVVWEGRLWRRLNENDYGKGRLVD